MNNFSLPLGKEITMKNFTMVFKKIYICVCKSKRPPPPPPPTPFSSLFLLVHKHRYFNNSPFSSAGTHVLNG